MLCQPFRPRVSSATDKSRNRDVAPAELNRADIGNHGITDIIDLLHKAAVDVLRLIADHIALTSVARGRI